MANMFETAAAELGLAHSSYRGGMASSVGTAFGRVGEIDLTVSASTTSVNHDATGRIAYVASARAALPLHLDLGLEVSESGLGLAALFGAQDVEVGDAKFDPFFTVRADEPDRVRALLQPAVRAALTSLVGVHPTLDDYGATVTVPPLPQTSAEALVALGRRTLALGQAMLAASRAVPGATPLAAHVPVWQAYATDQGYSFSPSPLVLAGRIEGAPFFARASRKGAGHFQLDARIDFDPPIAERFQLRPHRLLDGLERAFGAHAILTHDAHFDRAFTLDGGSPALVAATFGPEVRAGLLSLARLGDVHADARSLFLHRPLGAPEVMRDALTTMRAIVETIAPKLVGAYR